jgi:Flp pilus assembly protein TadD
MLPSDLEVLLECGLTDGAKGVCREILAEHPECGESLDLLGVHLRNRRELVAAVAVHRLACLREDWVSQFHNNLGVALTDVGLLDEAVAAFKRALELAGDDAQVLGNLGVALMRLGRLEEAKGVLARVAAMQPEAFQAQ